MFTWSAPIPFDSARGGSSFDAAANSLWLAGTDGTVASFRVFDRALTVRGTGYVNPVAVIALDDGLQVAVVERTGAVWAASRQRAGRLDARPVFDFAAGVYGAALAPDGRLLVLTADALHSLDVADGTSSVLLDDTAGAEILAVDHQLRTALLIGAANGTAVLRTVDLGTSAFVDTAMAVVDASALCTAPGGSASGVLVAQGTTVQLVPVLGGVALSTDIASPITNLARWGSLVLAVAADAVFGIEWELESGPMPLDIGPGLLFRGGYAAVTIDPAAVGLRLADLELRVDEGSDGGTVSAGIEPADTAGRSRVTLLAGSGVGEYHLRALSRSTGELLASRRFRVTGCWPDEYAGPPVVVTGAQQTFASGSWGGSGGAGPQNIPVQPAPAILRVAVVFIDVKQSIPPLAPSSAAWVDRLVGPGTSARRYYEEVSYYDPGAPVGTRSGTTVRQAGSRVFGPVQLDNAWGDLFDPNDIALPWRGWKPKLTTWQLVAGAFCDWLSDQPGDLRRTLLSATDSLLFLFRNGSKGPVMVGKDSMPAQYVWPEARGANFSWNSPTTYTERSLPMMFMPDGFPLAMPVDEQLFEPTATLCHELGHNLGLDDLYNAGKKLTGEVDDRIATDLDLMCSSRPLPHFSVANRMRLGWVRPNWIEVVDFAVSSAPRTISLRSTETTTAAGPPPGRRAGVEIRLRDGWNYYFEHRNPQPGQVGDQNLVTQFPPTGRMVLGTDVHHAGRGEPVRPSIITLGDDLDGDGPVLRSPGQDYQETDISNPGRAFDFRLRYVGIDPTDPEVVQVAVEHVEARRPQLQITPAPGGTDFKSPDIDLVGPAGVNALVKGAPHTVLVRVRNGGNVDAQNVLVQLRWLPFTTSSGDWNPLPDPPRQTVPAGATRTFSVSWTPPAELKIGDKEVEHFCVRADIERYIDVVDPAHSEITVFDNWAQSNFDATSASFNSPSSRRRTVFEVANPLPQEAVFSSYISQTSPWYRTYIGEAWQRLQPGEHRPVELMYESLAGDADLGNAFADAFEHRQLEKPNSVAIASRLVSTDSDRCASERPWWGAGLQVRAGRRCWFDDLRHHGELVSAVVLGGEPDGGYAPLTFGQVQLAVWDDRGNSFLLAGEFGGDGRVRVLLGHEIYELMQDGADLRAMLVRAESDQYARAISAEFPLQL